MGYARVVPRPLVRLILWQPKKLTPTLYAVLSSLPRGARIEKQVLVHSGRFITLDLDSSDEEEAEEDQQVMDKSPEFTQGVNVLHLDVYNITDSFVPIPVYGNDNKGDVTAQHPECPGAEIQLHYEISRFSPSSEACAVVFVRDSDVPGARDALIAQAAAQMKTIQNFTPFLERTLAAKAFVSHHPSARGRRMSNLCHVPVARADVIPRNTANIVPLLKAMFGNEMPALTIVPSCHVASRVGAGWDWAVTLMAV